MALLLLHALGSTDYYAALDSHRGATPAELKQAYKRAMIRFHPDRFEGAEKQRMLARFNAVQEAFEVLGDAQLRAAFDRGGAAALKEAQQLRQQREGFASQQRAQEERFAPQRPADPLQSSELDLLDLQAMPRFYRRGGVYVLLFYRDGAEVAAALPALHKIAADYRGVFSLARVNCGEEEELCREFLVYAPPRLLLFPSHSGLEGRDLALERFAAGLRAGAQQPLLDHVFREVLAAAEDFAVYLSPETLPAFERGARPKFVLFTAKAETPLTWKALSKEFRGAADFGVVKPSSRLAEALGAGALPAVHFYAGRLARPTVFEGKPAMAALKAFARDALAAAQAHPSRALQLVAAEELLAARSCADGEKKLCAVVLGEAGEAWEPLVEHFRAHFAGDPLKLALLPRERLGAGLLAEAAGASLLVYKGNRRLGRFFAVELRDAEAVGRIVSDCLSGIIALQPLSAPLLEPAPEL